MLTQKTLKENGIKFKQVYWVWLPETYQLQTSEFDESGELWDMDFRTYLILWANKLNKGQNREKYVVIKKLNGSWSRLYEWSYTIVEIMEEE